MKLCHFQGRLELAIRRELLLVLQHEQSVSRTAEALNMSRDTLYKHMRRFNIERQHWTKTAIIPPPCEPYDLATVLKLAGPLLAESGLSLTIHKL